MVYIHYNKKSDGKEYASVYESTRVGGKVKTKRLKTLSRVIDKDKGIFRSKGEIFKYSIKRGKSDAPLSYFQKSNETTEKLILDFGDT